MAKQLQAVRGMNDILPQDSAIWQSVEQTIAQVMARYGYQEIRLPIVESTALFKRCVGEATDIVEKETYTFDDRNGDSLTLRPEGTAGCVRAAIQRGLLHHQTQRLWYMGPMFRHERPQKGRYRQFHQFGVEVFGLASADIDAELLLLQARLWRELGLADSIQLEVNSLGSTQARQNYRQVLVDYFSAHYEKLDSDSQRRLHSNPLRILDSKNPDMQALNQNAPQITDYLDDASAAHFQQLTDMLDSAGLTYRVNPRLVRGLDYYTGTVFEWVTDQLGAQATVSAGGRYNDLVEQLGGRSSPGLGFALGMERLLLLQPQQSHQSDLDVYLMSAGERAPQQALRLAEQLRDDLPQLRLQLHCGGGSFKSQMKKADKSGASIALILGDDEVEQQQISVKHLREDREQATIAQTELVTFLSDR